MSEYISREETLKAIQPRYAPAINKVLAGIVNSVPAADVKPVVRGRWEPCTLEDGNDLIGYKRCSKCHDYGFLHEDNRGYWCGQTITSYCPTCGAEMTGVVQEGDENG